jgi:flagellar hook-basal body complex protein FliE
MRIDGAISGVTGIQPIGLEGAAAASAVPDGFAAALREQIDELGRLHTEASNMEQAFAAGQLTDINQVVLAVQKADLALNLALQLRNKVVEAYQEMTRMQV